MKLNIDSTYWISYGPKGIVHKVVEDDGPSKVFISWNKFCNTVAPYDKTDDIYKKENNAD